MTYKTFLAGLLALLMMSASPVVAQTRGGRTIGLALSGGSARGFAHVGVLRWLEEHRIPVDYIAGTSMGGLVGGAYAAGMTPDELTELLNTQDWDRMFGAPSFSYKTMQRKEDARAYPSRMELHARGGIALPIALNNGQQVDLLLQRTVGQYGALQSFDSLPTPFRTLALDLHTGQSVVLDRGPLARALRATMSMPGVFPPVHLDGKVLVDGGAMNNLPVDVVRKMGAQVVIAVKTGPIRDTVDITYSMLAIAQTTVSAMMRANTAQSLAVADIVINPAEKFGSLDWRLASALIEDGYRAAEACAQQLLPYALSEKEWAAHQAARAARRAQWVPVNHLQIVGATAEDGRAIERRVAPHRGQLPDLAALDRDFTKFSGMDRYVTVHWQMVDSDSGRTMLVEAIPDRTAPPFVMFTLNAQHRTAGTHTFQIASRFLTYDVVGRDSELRVDLTLGTDRGVVAELRRPLGSSGLFAAAGVAANRRGILFVDDDIVVADYTESQKIGLLDAGWSFSNDTELRAGIQAGWRDVDLRAGDPRLPETDGFGSEVHLRFAHDGQNSAIVPSRGTRVIGLMRYHLQTPELPASWLPERTNESLVQAELHGSTFWPLRTNHRRIFTTYALGTSFGDKPLPGHQFELGHSFRLDAFYPGEKRGDNMAAVSLGYAQTLARLPDFLGGGVTGALWLQSGSAFHAFEQAKVDEQLGLGVIIETLIGASMISYSFGPGASRFTFSIGRIFY